MNTRNITVYNNLTKIINSGKYEKDDILYKMDILILGGRLTAEESKKLYELIDEKFPSINEEEIENIIK